MNVRSTLRQLVRDLRTQKLRTFLTTFGLVWGTVAVSLLMAFGEGLHHQLLKNSAGLGNGIVIAWPSKTSMIFEGLGKGRPVRLDDDDLRLVQRRALEVGAISSEYSQGLRAQIGATVLSVDVSGVHPQFGPMRNLIPAPGGRFLNPLDLAQKRRVAFVGDELATRMFGEGDPVGRELRLHGSPFVVVGVLQPKIQESSYMGRDKDMMWIPATTMQALTGQKWMDNLIFTAADVSRTEEATDEVLGILAAKHRFDPRDKEALAVWDTSEMAAFLDVFMLAFKIFLWVVGSLTLVVGGIGVSNIMNVVVEERTREIGIKMALGARPRAVLGQFLLETAAIALVGGAVGLAISAGLCAAFPSIGVSDFVGTPRVSAGVAGATAALLGTIGLIAGWFPARAAARLDPVVAMKT